MKNNRYLRNSVVLVLLLVTVINFTSCEDVIDLDLNSSAPKLVAEGLIEKDSIAWVKLSYTSDYFANESVKIEENASLIIVDNDNNSEVLNYIGNGIYKGENIKGEIGKNYSVSISLESGSYKAISSLMPPSEIYDIVVSESEIQKPGNTEIQYSLEITFKQNPAIEDYFLLKYYVNNEFDSYVLLDDRVFVVGDTISYPGIKKSFSVDDKILVKLFSVDKDAYTYYKQLNDALGESLKPGSSSTPYNPASNFGADVLGYFAAWSYVSDSIIIE